MYILLTPTLSVTLLNATDDTMLRSTGADVSMSHSLFKCTNASEQREVAEFINSTKGSVLGQLLDFVKLIWQQKQPPNLFYVSL